MTNKKLLIINFFTLTAIIVVIMIGVQQKKITNDNYANRKTDLLKDSYDEDLPVEPRLLFSHILKKGKYMNNLRSMYQNVSEFELATLAFKEIEDEETIDEEEENLNALDGTTDHQNSDNSPTTTYGTNSPTTTSQNNTVNKNTTPHTKGKNNEGQEEKEADKDTHKDNDYEKDDGNKEEPGESEETPKKDGNKEEGSEDDSAEDSDEDLEDEDEDESPGEEDES